MSNDFDDTFDTTADGNGKKKKHLISRKRYEQIFSFSLICGILLIIIGGIAFGITQLKYYKANSTYNSAIDEFVILPQQKEKTTSKDSESGSNTFNVAESEVMIPWYEMSNIDMDSLKNKSPNSIGWIYFEDDSISYPVMYNADNEFYLDHMYNGAYSAAGSIFMDMINHVDFNDPYTILYGHNMKNGSMFGSLKQYKYQDYLNEHPYFQIILANKKYRYQIFAVQVISAQSNLYDISYDRDSLMDNKIKQLIKYSYVKSDLNISHEDTIINLSTCSGTENRLFVSAVLVDQTE